VVPFRRIALSTVGSDTPEMKLAFGDTLRSEGRIGEVRKGATATVTGAAAVVAAGKAGGGMALTATTC